MKVVGIIAEYNPFHNGHLYQINQIKEKTGATHIVAVMSGNFVQRGCPAWTDKYLRAQMALKAGVDIVFELPVCFSTASAETFALAGVSLLSSLGFVDGICFGSECGNLDLLNNIADFLLNPAEAFHSEMRDLVARGLSYPTARQNALIKHFAVNNQSDNNKLSSILSSPNNILAIEYLKAIRQLNSSLIPLTIKRNDAGYHNEKLDDCFASATAIRKQSLSDINIANNSSLIDTFSTATSHQNKVHFLNQVKNVLPEVVISLLKDKKSHFPITENDFSNLLFYRLEQLNKSDFSVLDLTPELYHRIKNYIADFTNYSDFTAMLKTKQYTYSRISRVLLHLLLDIRQDNFFFLPATHPFIADEQKADVNFISSQYPFVPYARLLGFSKTASKLLRHEAGIPIITKPADGLAQIEHFYSSPEDAGQGVSLTTSNNELKTANSHPVETNEYIDYAQKLYQKDIFAANLYTQVQNTKCNLSLPNEYHQKPVIV